LALSSLCDQYRERILSSVTPREVEAWINCTLPRLLEVTMPAWVTFLRLLPVAKKTTSPFSRLFTETFFPILLCASVVLGMVIPPLLKEWNTSAEQSIPDRVVPPYR